MNKHIAVYWDFENIHLSLCHQQFGADVIKAARFQKQSRLTDIPTIMQWVESLGEVCINRAYANWSFLSTYSNDLQNHCIDLIQLFQRGSHAKNGADIRMAVDVMDDLTHHDIDVVVIIGGDSDYIAVAQKVRARGRTIMGLGVQETTNPYWVRACHQFLYYHELFNPNVFAPPLLARSPMSSIACGIDMSSESQIETSIEAGQTPTYDDQDIIKMSHYLHDLEERYRRTLKDQQVRLVAPQLLAQSIRQSWHIFDRHPILESFDDFRQRLRDHMQNQVNCTETDLVKIKAILFKAHFFSIDPDQPGVRRDPALTSPEKAIERVQQILIRRIAMETHAPLNLTVLQMIIPEAHQMSEKQVQQMVAAGHESTA